MTRFAFDGTVAIVTGGSRGIGPHIAAALGPSAEPGSPWWRAVSWQLDAVAATLREDGGRGPGRSPRTSPRPPTGAASSKPPNGVARSQSACWSTTLAAIPQREFHNLTEHRHPTPSWNSTSPAR